MFGGYVPYTRDEFEKITKVRIINGKAHKAHVDYLIGQVHDGHVITGFTSNSNGVEIHFDSGVTMEYVDVPHMILWEKIEKNHE